MNDLPRLKLKEMLQSDSSIQNDARRCKGLLLDRCGQYRSEIFVLTSAIGLKIPNELMDPDNKIDNLLISRLSKRLQDNCGFSKEASEWCIKAWLSVLKPDEAFNIKVDSVTDSGQVGPITPLDIDIDSHPGRTVVSKEGTADFHTINEAIRNIMPGGEIVVKEGKYEEFILIDKPVKITGDGIRKNIIICGNKSGSILNKSDDVRLQNLTIQNTSGAHNFMIDIESGNINIYNCDIWTNTYMCIVIHGPKSYPRLTNCDIHGAEKFGIFVYNNSKCIVDNCIIKNNGDSGIIVTQKSHIDVVNSNIEDNGNSGVYLDSNSSANILDCDIKYNRNGPIYIGKGCKVLKNRSFV